MTEEKCCGCMEHVVSLNKRVREIVILANRGEWKDAERVIPELNDLVKKMSDNGCITDEDHESLIYHKNRLLGDIKDKRKSGVEFRCDLIPRSALFSTSSKVCKTKIW